MKGCLVSEEKSDFKQEKGINTHCIRGAVSELWQIEPRYMLTGGVIGAFITYTVIKSFDALGPAKSALLIVVAQILVAYLIEVFGWFGVEKAGFEWRKAIGAAVAIAGIVIFRWE